MAPRSLVDEHLSEYDISDAVSVIVAADTATTWTALMDTDLIEVGRKRPLVAVLGAIRALPDLLHQLLIHGRVQPGPDRLRLGDLASLPLQSGGWVALGRREQEEIAFGLVGKFWRPVIEFAQVPTADAFRAFSTPGYAKTVYSLSVRPLADGRTVLTGVMRTATTDAAARRWFRRYWTLGVGSGAHLLVANLLEVARDAAEHKVLQPL